jgi:hypothetical protein
MSWKRGLGWCAAALALGTAGARAQAPDATGSLAALARLSVSGEPGGAKTAVAALRAAGYPGLDALVRVGGPTATRICWTRGLDDRSKRWCAAVDAVAGQRDASASRLFWHTDFEKARAEALATGKPILSLRLLGRLDEELSCANSRYFRAALYADTDVAEILRNRFVLHWKTVRPVPKVRIDFGDGRTLERTITGNSAHYMLASDGRPIDALPGLYGPKAFRDWLIRAEGVARRYATSPGPSGESLLAAYHAERFRQIDGQWRSDRAAAGIAAAARPPSFAPGGGAVPASRAMPLAMSKARVEKPLLKVFSTLLSVAAAADDAEWAKLGARHGAEARLGATSRKLLARESREGESAEAALRNFEASMAEDTVRNEYTLHSRIHEWFATRVASPDVDRLNDRVYSEIFLTPGSDPWLGLLPPDRFAGLTDGGVRTATEPIISSR